jgi:hypothetical protein
MSSRLIALVAFAAAAVGCSTETARAQDWRDMTSMRQAAGEEELVVSVEYGAGRLQVRPGDAGLLYRANLRYDAAGLRPDVRYDPGRLRVRLEGQTRRFRGLRDGGRLDLALGPDTPMELDLQFGAVEADIELGGLPVRRLRLATGASDSKVRFSSPNPERCRRIDVDAGAASLQVRGLGNANAERFKFSGGVGDITLDFTGAWERNMTAEVSMGLGSLTLRIPEDLGVRVERSTFLTSFDSQRLVKRGNYYYSENWDTAEHRLTLKIDAAFGSINVRWVGAAVAAR